MAEFKETTVYDLFGNKIEISVSRWKHILEQHPEIMPYLENIKQTIGAPDVVKLSVSDRSVRMYYRFFSSILGGKYLLVVIKTNKRNFVITAYITDYIKTGEEIWKRRS